MVYKALSILLYPSISLHPSHWPLQCHVKASQKSQIIFAGGSCLSLKCVYWPVTWQLNHDFEELAHILLLNTFSSVRYEKLQPRPVFYLPLAGLHFLLPRVHFKIICCLLLYLARMQTLQIQVFSSSLPCMYPKLQEQSPRHDRHEIAI